MKRIVSLFCLVIFLYFITFSTFAFTIDGIDKGVEWNGATVYSLLDGESNCGVDFGLVKVKFDYDSSSVYFCFFFSEPGLAQDNQSAGVSFAVDDSPAFEIVASDGYCTYNIDSYSYEGAIYLDENNGATCEVRIGIKSGLPEMLDGVVRFIDSQGYYSNYYRFTVINENYVPTDALIIRPTSDNSDPAFNPGINADSGSVKKTTQNKTTKATTKKNTAKKTTNETTRENITIKTSPPYSYTGRAKTTKQVTAKEPTVQSTKANKTQKQGVSVFYYEKDVYISQVYVTQPTEASSEMIESSNDTENVTSVFDEIQNTNTDKSITLSEGTKYKKIVSAICLAAFIGIAFFGIISARKGTESDK